jgi:hypothetical protein
MIMGDEFVSRQESWRKKLECVDQLPTTLLNCGTLSPTRVLLTKTEEEAIVFSRKMFDSGYYVPPVFLPNCA